jgi:NADPH2:quinone reductase
MPHAIRIHETGGPEVLRFEEVELKEPGPGQVLLRQTASGLNFVDVQLRRGVIPSRLPAILGNEGAGVVEALGPGVDSLKLGDRVAYGMSTGSYATHRLIRADSLVKLPDAVSDVTAAAMMLKGLTAQYLVKQAHRLQAGETVLIQAAAGGVGMLLSQWCAALGATVIGTVSSDEKAALARANGCDHAIVYTREDFVARVKELTGGAKVDVVYDAVGAETFMKSLDCLKPTGHIVSYGNAGEIVPPLDIRTLGTRGSLTLTRATLQTYLDLGRLQPMARDLFEAVTSGRVKVTVNQTYALADAARAHRDLEGRKTTGSSVLLI